MSSDTMQQQQIAAPALPAEMWAAIFSYLSLEDIMVSVRPVCRQWRDIADGNVLTTSLTFGPAAPTNVVLRLLLAAPSLRYLELNQRSDLPVILGAIFGLCRLLQRLTLRKCEPKIHGAVLAEILSTCPRIHSLCINTMVSQTLDLCQKLGSALPELRWLSLTGSYVQRDLHILLDNCPRLERLVFGNTSVIYNSCLLDEDVSRIAQRLAHTLQMLEFNASKVTDSGLAALGGCTHLRDLCLHWPCRITAGGLNHLKELKKLEVLTLSKVQVLAQQRLRNFFLQSVWIGQLRALTINGCREFKRGILGNIANSCSRLQQLALTKCVQVTGQGLVSVLRRCRELRRLDLSGTKVRPATFLMKIPRMACQLQVLVYNGNEPDDAKALAELRAAAPYLRIEEPDESDNTEDGDDDTTTSSDDSY